MTHLDRSDATGSCSVIARPSTISVTVGGTVATMLKVTSLLPILMLLCSCSDEAVGSMASLYCNVMTLGSCPSETAQDTTGDAADQSTVPSLEYINNQMPVPNYQRPSRELMIASGRSTYRDASYCIQLDPRTDGGDVGLSVINRCGERVTVHTESARGQDFITVGPGVHNWTTLVQTLSYACFVEAGAQICEK